MAVQHIGTSFEKSSLIDERGDKERESDTGELMPSMLLPADCWLEIIFLFIFLAFVQCSEDVQLKIIFHIDILDTKSEDESQDKKNADVFENHGKMKTIRIVHEKNNGDKYNGYIILMEGRLQ